MEQKYARGGAELRGSQGHSTVQTVLPGAAPYLGGAGATAEPPGENAFLTGRSLQRRPDGVVRICTTARWGWAIADPPGENVVLRISNEPRRVMTRYITSELGPI